MIFRTIFKGGEGEKETAKQKGLINEIVYRNLAWKCIPHYSAGRPISALDYAQIEMENSPRADAVDVYSSSSGGNRFHPLQRTLIGRLRLGKKRGGMKIRSREKYDREML